MKILLLTTSLKKEILMLVLQFFLNLLKNMKKNQKNFLLCLINIHHTAVKGLTVNEKEDNKTRITTGYFNIGGARHSFELWLFYFNFMRRSKGIFKNTLDFIDTKANIDDLNMHAK